MASGAGLEAALAAAEEQAAAALRTVAGMSRELKKARAAAAGGQMRDMRRAQEAAETLAGEAARAVSGLRREFRFDEQGHLASGGYTKELLGLAAEAGVTIVEEDNRLLCYPSVVRVLAGDAAIEVDKARDRRIRPSVVLRTLAARQARPARFKPEPFLASLLAAYELVVAQGGRAYDATVALTDVWSVLTLLPGQGREYTRQEFARDLYLLDQSGVSEVRGRTMSLPASTLTKKTTKVLSTVTMDGRQKLYSGISFS
jgi:hypothetical protein